MSEKSVYMKTIIQQVLVLLLFSTLLVKYSDEDRPALSASSRTSLLQQLGRGGASRVLDLEVDLAENDMHSTTRLVKELRNRETQSDENIAKVRVTWSSIAI